MSVSTENFLKTLYLLNQSGEMHVSSSMLAQKLRISPAAVSDMARKLGRDGLLIYQPYHSLTLSGEGEKNALSILRKHRLWELFLYEVLGMDLLSVHEEAERLEHNTSEKLCEKMYKFLGKPSFDPHGDPIPGADGEMPSESGIIPLSEGIEGRNYVIRKLRYSSGDSAEMFERYGLKKGLVCNLIKKYAFDGSIEIVVGAQNIVISNQLGSYIFCREKNDSK